MRIMGVDPGTIRMGEAILDGSTKKFESLFHTTVALKQKRSIHKRLHDIYCAVQELIEEWNPEVLALEDVFHGVSFKSAIRIGEARAAVILAATACNTPVVEYLPTRVKSAVCGSGRAAKIQVQNMVRSILGLRELPETDAADALAIAICHMHTIKN